MKRLMWLLSVAMIISLSSCNKDAIQENKQGEIVFTSTDIVIDKDGEITCDSPVSYALVYIDGTEYTMPVFLFNGMLTTQAIQLDAGVHILGDFILMNNNETPNDTSDDLPVYASVHSGAGYSEYVSFLVEYEFNIEPFIKYEQHVEVICVELSTYEDFGFEYFTIWETIIREQCFFYDLCVLCLDDYATSAYANQQGGVLLDNAAIIKIDVYRNSNYINSFDNYDVYGEDVVCVQYADRLGISDYFEFNIYVWLPVGGIFQWVHQYSYSFYDDEILDSDQNGVNTGVIGNCTFEEMETNLVQYIDLPVSVDFSVGSTVGPSPITNAYFDLSITAPAGYEWFTGIHAGFCAQNSVYISTNTVYTGNVYNSLNPVAAAAAMDLDVITIKKLHWLVNNLEGYGYDLNNLQAGDWEVIQNVIWYFSDNGSTSGIESVMAADGDADWINYSPLPNEDENVLVILYNDVNVQLQIIKVGICN